MPHARTTADAEPLLVSVAEMARVLGISRAQAYVLLNRERIESRYVGRRRLIPYEAVRHIADSLPRERPD